MLAPGGISISLPLIASLAVAVAAPLPVRGRVLSGLAAFIIAAMLLAVLHPLIGFAVLIALLVIVAAVGSWLARSGPRGA